MTLIFYVPFCIAAVVLAVLMVRDGMRTHLEIKNRKRVRDSRPRYYR